MQFKWIYGLLVWMVGSSLKVRSSPSVLWGTLLKRWLSNESHHLAKRILISTSKCAHRVTLSVCVFYFPNCCLYYFMNSTKNALVAELFALHSWKLKSAINSWSWDKWRIWIRVVFYRVVKVNCLLSGSYLHPLCPHNNFMAAALDR